MKVFGMTASPTVECVQVLQSKAYVCEDDLIEEFQANAEWELLFYKVKSNSGLLGVCTAVHYSGESWARAKRVLPLSRYFDTQQR